MKLKDRIAAGKKSKFADTQRQNAQYAADDSQRRSSEEAIRGPGYRSVSQGSKERAAGVTPPGFEGVRDVKTGQLLSQYKTDPYAGEALQALKGQAFAQGDSPWAKMQLDKQAMEQSGAADSAAQAQAQGLAQAQGNLMRQGGLSSGARTRMAMQGARDLAMAQQGVAGQGMKARLGIQEQDLNRKQDLLGKFGDAEAAATQQNIGLATGDIKAGTAFDMDRYGKQMEAYGAEKTAEGQRAAASAGSKCFDATTKVLMSDLTEKNISEIRPADEVFAGGIVLDSRSYFSEDGFELYDYDGVMLTGSHSVKESGEWRHVENSIKGVKTKKVVKEVYTLVTENHFIIANKVVFSDDVETNENLTDEVKSLEALNLEG
jgi:hypothetical protein